jgi:PAS domain S-box-containing protein
MSRQAVSADARSTKSQQLAIAMAVLALVVGLVLTTVWTLWSLKSLEVEAQARFNRLVERVQADVQNKLNAPLLGLKGASGVYAASNSVERGEFRAYVEFSQLKNEFPGVRGFGFMERVMREDVERFVAAQRADGEPGFSVVSPDTFGSRAADLYVVKFLEPRAQNHAALGLDGGADALSREAIERAVATGEPTLSKKITLLGDETQGSGWVYLLPVFRVGTAQTTPAQRETALLGVLFAPMVVRDMMQGVAGAAQGQADFELFDGAAEGAGELVYDHDGHLASVRGTVGQLRDADRLFRATRPILAGGRTLTLRVSGTPAFEVEAVSPLPALLGLGGAALSLLLALCVWLLGSGRARALAKAQRMTLSLAHEQQRLLSIVEGTNAGTWEWDVTSGETRVDERWAGILGYSVAELMPVSVQTWNRLLHPDDLAQSDALMRAHFSGQTPYYECESRMRHKDGRWIWTLSRGRVSVWTGERRACLMAGTLMDITERQTAQLALRNSEEHFRQLFETSLESILQTRPDGRLIHANPAACALFGMGVAQMRERGVFGLVDPNDTRLPALLEERAREGKVRGELRMLHADGTPFECELSSSIFEDLDNEPCATVVLRDITARKRTEVRITRLNAELEQRVSRRTAQLEASNRDLQEFAHSVAHDLRQPFIAIGGFSGLLERTVADERARHYIERIKAGVRQAGDLTDALLALANLSRVELRLQDVDLSAVAHSLMARLQQQGVARVARISIQEGLEVKADPMLIKLVLEELLGNAWKFTSRQASTEISFGLQSVDPQATPTATVYVVRDNGEGFDMAHVDKLFRSFQRLHSPQDFPGAGIGLTNIQRIVARHDGRIWAESAPGEGASFFFTLGGGRSDNAID